MALDPSYSFYSDGTITLTNGSDIATGQFVGWDAAVLPFDFVFPQDGTAGMTVVKEVLAADQIRLAKPWTGPTLTGVSYFMVRWTKHTDPRIYALRVSDYLTRLRAIPENLEEIGQQVAADRDAVDAALVTLQQIEAAVDADRLDAQAAATSASADAEAADQARIAAEAARDAAMAGSVSDNAVTNTKLADMATGTIKGRSSAGTGDPQDLTAAQVLELLQATLDARYVLLANGLSRNRIINGNFAVNKRGVSGTVTLAAGAYGHDRWKAGASGCTYTFSVSGSNPSDIAIVITSGSLMQVIEDREIEGGVYTLSWSGSATGRVAINGGTTSGAYAAGPITTASATAGQAIAVEFTAGSVTRVQLEPGISATSFERRMKTLEEYLCARYFQVLDTAGTKGAGFTGAVNYSSDNLIQIPMRAAPNITYTDAALYNNASGRTESAAAISVSMIGHGAGGVVTANSAYLFGSYSGTGTTFGFVARNVRLDAEL